MLFPSGIVYILFMSKSLYLVQCYSFWIWILILILILILNCFIVIMLTLRGLGFDQKSCEVRTSWNLIECFQRLRVLPNWVMGVQFLTQQKICRSPNLSSKYLILEISTSIIDFLPNTFFLKYFFRGFRVYFNLCSDFLYSWSLQIFFVQHS